MLTLRATETNHALEVNGTVHTVAITDAGYFTVTHRSERLSASSLAELQRRIEQTDAEAQAKRDRVKALKEAAARPIPALYGGDLEPVGVRGVDQRTGKYLITDADGNRTQVQRLNLYRPLTGAEQQRFVQAQQDMKEAAEALAALPGPTSTYDLARHSEESVVADYSPALGAFFLDYQGTKIGPAMSLRDMKDLLVAHLAQQRFAALLTSGGEVLPLTADAIGSSAEMFATREQAEAYRDAKARSRAARAAFGAVEQEYRFTSLTDE